MAVFILKTVKPCQHTKKLIQQPFKTSISSTTVSLRYTGLTGGELSNKRACPSKANFLKKSQNPPTPLIFSFSLAPILALLVLLLSTYNDEKLLTLRRNVIHENQGRNRKEYKLKRATKGSSCIYGMFSSFEILVQEIPFIRKG